MALDFDLATTDRVDCGSGANLDDWSAFTYAAWIFVQGGNNTQWGRLVSKGNDMKEFIIAQVSGTRYLQGYVARATTDAQRRSADSLATSSWLFVAMTYDESNSVQLYQGDLTTAVAEASSYSPSTAGSGSTTVDAANELWVGNRSTGSTNRSPDAVIDCVIAHNARLTLNQLRALQFHMRVIDGNTGGFWKLGWHGGGGGSTPDWSGNGNTGSIVGASQVDGAPLRPLFGFDFNFTVEPAVAVDGAYPYSRFVRQHKELPYAIVW